MDYIPWVLLALLAFWILRAVFRSRQREEEMTQRLADRDPRRIKLGRSSANARTSAAMIHTRYLFVDPSESLSGHNPLDPSSTFDTNSNSGGPDCYEPSSSDNNCGDGNNQSAGDCSNWGDSGFSSGADSGFSGGSDFSSSSDCGSSSTSSDQ